MNTLTKKQRENCRILAEEILPRVPREQFDMNTWTVGSHSCGTVGCAMGWAAMSGRIPGLQWAATKKTAVRVSIYYAPREHFATTIEEADFNNTCPLIRGERSSYHTAAEVFFGEEAQGVFLETTLSKRAVIDRLLKLSRGESL